MKKILGIFLGFLLILNTYAADNRFDTIVMFGDSMSDNGNLYKYFLHLLPVSPPYYQGHFSNGPLWTEYLYNSYFPNEYTIGFQDYAVGGAGAVLSLKENLPFTLTAELNNYLYWHTYGKKESSLFSIWIGANNYINEPKNVEELTDGVVNAIGNVLERLIENGGNKFLVANLPDLARAPQAKDSPNQWLLTQLTLAHNRKLEELIESLKVKYPDSIFIYMDVYTFFNNSIARASEFGLTNLDDPCYQGSYSGWLSAITPDDAALYRSLKKRSPQMTEQQWLMIKSNPDLLEAAEVGYFYDKLPAFQKLESPECDNYLFWDKVHPTTKVHKLIADYAKGMIDNAGLQAFVP